jgi:hypothetical protein
MMFVKMIQEVSSAIDRFMRPYFAVAILFGILLGLTLGIYF